MAKKSASIRAEPHCAIGAVLVRDASTIIERWAKRAKEEQHSAKRVHHDSLLNHLPTFLWELGRRLAEETSDTAPSSGHFRSAGIHGDQRWEIGWSLGEMITDYQLLRIVILEYLAEVLPRPLSIKEILALGVYIDDAISASVLTYVSNQEAVSRVAAEEKQDPAQLFSILGILGHELRNPLSPLGNSLHILKLSGNNPSVVERASQVMERQYRVLTRLVDDLMDVPRLAQGKMNLRFESLDIARLVENVVNDRRSAFETAGIHLLISVSPEPIFTTGDPQRLTQAVGNLLANALKFTDSGGTVEVAVIPDSARSLVSISIRDSGIGMEPEFLPRIFDAFVQVDGAVERSKGGLGLGLALVKGIIELHGGAVRVSSDGLGKGTLFTLELPIIDRPHNAGVIQNAAASVSRSILVVEDNWDSAESVKTCLEMFGHTVSIAHSGPAALEIADSVRPDVVICDIGLPGMSGHDVCAELRKLPSLKHTVFIALTGHASDTRSGSDVSSGFDVYLIKPATPEKLAAVIDGTERTDQ